MPDRRPTLDDVARLAGLSRTTASFVLAGREDMRISPDAQRRVREAAEELGYRPNRIALSLRTSVTNTIGLVTDSVATDELAGDAIAGGVEAARAHGTLLFVAQTGSDPDTEAMVLNAMQDRRVDGLIYATLHTREVRPPPDVAGRPLVLLNCLPIGFAAPSVVPDEAGAGRAAARVLLDAGHRDRIHVIGGRHVTDRTPDGVYAGRQRMRGVEEALRRAGTRPAGVTECAWDAPEPGYEAVAALLAGGAAPTALICCNDRLAFGAYRAIGEFGLRVPDEVSVVSFGDSSLASWLRPQLTSIALPHHELGRTAVELLLSGDLEPRVHRLPMPVRRRASVGPAR
jgi:LacI family transcriptional regulator